MLIRSRQLARLVRSLRCSDRSLCAQSSRLDRSSLRSDDRRAQAG